MKGLWHSLLLCWRRETKMSRFSWERPKDFPLAAGKRRLKFTIAYDGAHFSGWQRQHQARTVQEELEKVLLKMLKEEVTVHGSGRTDAGVHALAQVAHIDIANQSVPIEAFVPALNQLLPRDVRLLAAELVDEHFHARFTTISREYHYYVKEERNFTPFDHQRAAKVKEFPNLELLNGYATTILGTHNFTTFGASADQSHSKIRDVYHSFFTVEPSKWGGDLLIYKVCANAFLMHQVRSMVGTMLQFGSKGYTVDEFKRVLNACNRLEAGRTSGPEGLYLYRILYD